jgi:hypothetical protein
MNSKNKIDYIKLNKIFDYVNYPEMKDLKENLGEKKEKLNEENFRKLLRVYNIANILRKKVRDFYNDLKNESFRIQGYIEKINIECDIKNLEVTNSLLESIIKFLKYPNILLLKIKIIEAFLFNLYKFENNQFLLPQNYMHNKFNLEELVKLIESKEVKNGQSNKKKRSIYCE